MKQALKATAFLILSNSMLLAVLSAYVPAAGGSKPPRPPIVLRKDWGAKPPVGKARKHRPRYITIHHTATRQKPDVPIGEKMLALQAFSQREDRLASGKLKPVWFDVPYHYYISVDGLIAQGRKLKYVGDTNTEYNPTGHALIVLEGSFNTEEPSAMQIESLKSLVAWIAYRHKIPVKAIKGHSDYATTTCPGDNLKKMFPELRTAVR